MGKSVMEVIAETKEKHLRKAIQDGLTPSEFEEFWKTQEGEVSRRCLRIVEEEEAGTQSSKEGTPPPENVRWADLSDRQKIDFVNEHGEEAAKERIIAEYCKK